MSDVYTKVLDAKAKYEKQTHHGAEFLLLDAPNYEKLALEILKMSHVTRESLGGVFVDEVEGLRVLITPFTLEPTVTGRASFDFPRLFK